MVRYIDDHIHCGQCQNEANEGYNVNYETLCGDCLKDLYFELGELFRWEGTEC